MNRLRRLLLACAGAALLAAAPAALGVNARSHRPACPGPAATGNALCHALVVTDSRGQPQTTGTPAGYGPADLRSAYNLPSAGAGYGQTIAIVDAYDDPNAEKDLATYRSTYGLTPCTTANGCFRKVNQQGGTSYPRGNTGWAEEISLDLDMASAICPNCHVLLVEASSNSLTNLGAAVREAKALGATEISNSYGASEFSSETSYDSYYDWPGVAVTASTGDGGYGVEYPAASPDVTAVGGTTLTRAPSTARGWTETVWSGAGSGCSAYEPRPSWQSANSAIAGVCSRRAVADVSADADPNTGVSVYDTYREGGWLVFGGTSVASPIVAATYALAGNASSLAGASAPYASPGSLFDITSGSNGGCGTILCNAAAGWDGPTGLGTPNGTGGF